MLSAAPSEVTTIPTEVFLAVVMVAFSLIPVTLLGVTRQRDWGAGRAHRISVRAKLPFGSDETARNVAARARSIFRANLWGSLIAIAVVASGILLVPLGLDGSSVGFAAMLIVWGSLTASTAIVTVRERLFSPAPTAPRIARTHPLRRSDYVGPWRRFIPWVLLGVGLASVVAIFATAPTRGFAPTGLALVAAAAVFAVIVSAAGRWAEHRVLAQPQPAADSLELAWDDLFRADALNNLRLGMTLGTALVITCTASLWLDASWPRGATSLPAFPVWWGMFLLPFLFTAASERLPAALYPAHLTHPAVQRHEGTALA
ncbi:hypothetical protein ACFXQA_12085 [Microbacterium sp. P07]|uniref:hypothetical protein n=1 Tax=Microbacterium sp. P07 TaxID=3366952 RepID=UPI003744B9A1